MASNRQAYSHDGDSLVSINGTLLPEVINFYFHYNAAVI